MRRWSYLLALTLAAGGVACATSSQPTPATDPSDGEALQEVADASKKADTVSEPEMAMEKVTDGGADDREPVNPADMLGPLTEEGFQALHTLKTATAPGALGELVTLSDGSTAYLSLPEGDGPHPAILVIHEWWGLNQHIKYWADRLAADGYAALAVDLYGGEAATTSEQAMSLMKSVERPKAEATLKAGHAFLATEPRVMATTQGSIGWCFGGGWSLQYGLMTPDLDAVVMYYGKVVTDPEALSALNAPVLGVFANLDEGIPVSDVKAFEKALKTAGKSFTLLRYEANHAFANPSGQRYDAAAAEDAWEEVRGFLGHTLKGEPLPSSP